MKVMLLCLSLISFVQSGKILGIFPMPSLSHHILGSKIISDLVERGHDVIMVTPYPNTVKINNNSSGSLKYVSVDSNLHILEGYSKSSSLKTEGDQEDDQNKRKKSFFDRESHNTVDTIMYLQDLSLNVAERTLSNPNFHEVLNSQQQFDLILMEYFLNEAYLALGDFFSAPVVLLSTLPTSSFNNYLVGNPDFLSCIPHILSPFSSQMNIWERLANSFYTLFDITYKHFVMLPKQKALVDKYIPKKIDFESSLYNASLLLVNSHPSVTVPVPHVKNVIEIGGFHIDKDGGNIPAALKKELDDSKEGVVVFSMGSNLKSNDLPREKLEAIIKTFSKLRQKVIWKWDSNIQSNLPKNIKTLEWFPQQLILAHPNVKAFVTHGGLLSMIEAVYAGVPVLGIPIYGDQRMNLAVAVDNGFAALVPYKDLTYEKLSTTLDEILNNNTYTTNAKLRSKIMRDRLTLPLDEAVYWIEYVMRYQGAPHLKSPALRLPWYKINMLEIIILLTLITIILFFLFYIIFKHIVKCRYLRRVSDSQHSYKKND